MGLKEAEFVATPSFVEKSLYFRKALPKGYENFVAIGIDGADNPVEFNSQIAFQGFPLLRQPL